MQETPFLKYVANAFTPPTDLRDLKDYCFVFPSIRAGVYFRKYLVERFKGQYFWSPHIYSIVEFTEYLTDKVVLDPTTLIFELFSVYKKYEPEVRFDDFYHWGQLVLKDYDEVDKYLVDANRLFVNLKDLKVLEEEFSLDEEPYSFLNQFWRVLDKEEHSELEAEFIRIWEVLGTVFHAFKIRLAEQNAAYEGMVQREIADQLLNKSLQVPFKQITFAGFNALSKGEKTIIEELVQQFNAQVYWDTDAYYMQAAHQEAGKFVRQYHKLWKHHPNHHWGSQTNLKKAPKDIQLIGVPLKVGQTKYTGQLLQDLVKKDSIDLTDTAIVLGDESLLFPMLYTLPEEIETINITMGYPLKNTPLYQLLESIYLLQKSRQEREVKAKPDPNNPDAPLPPPTVKILFYSRYILEIINNPFIKAFDKESVRKYMSKIERKNMVYAYDSTILESFGNHPVYQAIFRRLDTFQDLNECFQQVLTGIFNAINYPEEGQEKQSETTVSNEEVYTLQRDLELEFIYHLLKQLKSLEETLYNYRQIVDFDTFWRIFRESLQSVKLPFTGEPLKGIQIMGFLESRTIDFKNVFVLGLNEGSIPASKPDQSFIPFNLRRGFGLPTFLDQDAIFAYHFYHLLQRCSNAYLFYNTEVGSLGGGEMSRFLLQVDKELIPDAQINFRKQLITAPIPSNSRSLPVVTIPKTDAVMQRLSRYVINIERPETESPKGLTPSALTTYINCPVQFYFKYVAQLYELETLDEEINAMIFGNVLHKTIELLYEKYTHDYLTETIIESILNDDKLIEKQLHKAFKAENFEHHTSGQNLLLKRVIFKLVKKILENDIKDAPIKIIGLEAREYKANMKLDNGREIMVTGIIDRIDQIMVNGSPIVRVLDYKTGKVELNETQAALKLPIDQYIHAYFDNPRYKTGFQAYLYSYLYWLDNKNKSIVAGLYALKEINQGIRYLRKQQALTSDFFETYGKHLTNMLEELFNQDHPFIQATDEKRYHFSPYKVLVGS